MNGRLPLIRWSCPRCHRGLAARTLIPPTCPCGGRHKNMTREPDNNIRVGTHVHDIEEAS